MWIGTEVTVKEDVGIGLYCGYGVCGDRESRTLYPLGTQFSKVHPEAKMTHPMFKFQIFLSFEIEEASE